MTSMDGSEKTTGGCEHVAQGERCLLKGCKERDW